MSRVDPVDPHVRLAIVQRRADAPRGAVTTFSIEHGISRETFYAIRFHRTLFRWLDKQPLADTLEELQAQVDAFDLIRLRSRQRRSARTTAPG